MRKSKAVAISFNEIQKKQIDQLSDLTGMSVSRVIHMMTIYMLNNSEAMERLKVLNEAFAGSALPDKYEACLISTGNYVSEDEMKNKDAITIAKTKWIED